ncbi:MAG: VCBS repeat-containing protein [Planctomycetota bacterium]
MNQRHTGWPASRARRIAALLTLFGTTGAHAQVCNAGSVFVEPLPKLESGERPNSVVSVDLNGDGLDDLAFANSTATGSGLAFGGSVTVLLASSDGNYDPPQTLDAGAFTTKIAIGHLNADDHPDIVALNANSSDISVFVNNGDGSFEPQRRFPITLPQNALGVADMNSDGFDDVVVASLDGPSLQVMLNRGDATFGRGTPFVTRATPVQIAIADLTGDDRPDVATVLASGDLVIYPYAGAGALSDIRLVPGDTDLVATADVDDDGDIDIIRSSDGITVLKNNGNGFFFVSGTFVPGTEAQSLRLGDLNGDGAPDISMVNAAGTVDLLVNDGQGAFTLNDRSPAGAVTDLAITDTNVDEIPDIVIINQNEDAARALLNDGSASIDGFVALGNPTSYGISIVDLESDGDQDLAVAARDSDTLSFYTNQGDGTFAFDRSIPAGSSPLRVVAADLNDDGRQDFVLVRQQSRMSVLIDRGDKTFSFTEYITPSFPTTVEVGDLSNDGVPDIAVSSSSEAVVFYNNGEGLFLNLESLPAGRSPQDAVIADLDRDGIQDVAIANGSDSDVTFLINTGAAFDRFDIQVPSPRFIEAADLDDNGWTDVVVTTSAGALYVFWNSALGFEHASPISSDPAVSPSSLDVADIDGNGFIDLAVSNMSSDIGGVYLNQGNREFVREGVFVGGRSFDIQLGDLDGNGTIDLAASLQATDVVLRFNQCPPGCSIADLVRPFDVVDLSDLDAYVEAFVAGDAIADLAPPFGTIDTDDADAFIAVFLAGCP